MPEDVRRTSMQGARCEIGGGIAAPVPHNRTNRVRKHRLSPRYPVMTDRVYLVSTLARPVLYRTNQDGVIRR